MSFILTLGVLGIASSMVWFRRRMAELDATWSRKRMLSWAARGIAVPTVFFLVYCSGMGGVSPPWISWIAKQSGASWMTVTVGFALTGIAFAVTFWAAVTLSWFYTHVYRHVPSESRAEFAGMSGIWLLLTSPFWLGLLWWMKWIGVGLAMSVLFGFLVYATLPLVPQRKRSPLYARAVACIVKGNFSEAELEIIRQLESYEDDFEGWMLLAEVYAVHFRDIGAAEQTIAQLIEQENLGQAQLATALHRLADWQLRLNLDPVGARLTLEEIGRRFPGTNLARIARDRIERLPSSRSEMEAQQKGRAVHMPANADPFSSPSEDAFSRSQAAQEANALSEKLRANPDDVESREAFAWLLAERLGKIDLAFEQLELLREMPTQSDQKQARWLALAAAWELRHRQDRSAARILMRKLVSEYPKSPQAFAAQRRLNLIEMEEKLASRSRPQPPQIKI